MHISGIYVSDTRSFSGQRSVDLRFDQKPLPRWIVVAGRNGAGKSTLLQAIALSIAGPSVARALHESFAGWIAEGQDEALVATRLTFSQTWDGFIQGGRIPTFVPWAGMSWRQQPEGPEPLMDNWRTGGSWTPRRGPWADNPQGWFLAGYGPFRRISSAPSEAQRLMMTAGRPSALASLFREDASLSESVRWLQQIYLRRLEGIEKDARIEKLVLSLLNDGLLPEGMTVTKISSEGLWITLPSGEEMPLRSMSDGYRTVAALVLDLLKQLLEAYGNLWTLDDGEGANVITNEGVVLIDEIDVHLHVSWQQKIGFWLKQHFAGVQFIVTTHSPFICQAADAGGLVRLPAPGENAPAEIVDDDRFNRVVRGTIDEALLSDLFGLEHSYSDSSMLIRNQIGTLEAAESVGALDEATKLELERLRSLLPSSITEDVLQSLASLAAMIERP